MKDWEEFKAAARAAAWDEGLNCPTCGEGRVDGGRKVIHCMGGGFIGADWGLDSVLDAIDKAEKVGWADHWNGHDMVVDAGDRVWRFQVSAPWRSVDPS